MKFTFITLFSLLLILSCEDKAVIYDRVTYIYGTVTDASSSNVIPGAWLGRDSIYYSGQDALTDSLGHYLYFAGFAGSYVDLYCGKDGYITQLKRISTPQFTNWAEFKLVKR